MPNLLAGCRGSVPSPSSAAQPLPHFQSSMLLHNLSRNFSLSKKASQRALRCTRVLHRTTAITHPAANAHQAAPRPPITGARSTRPAASLHPAANAHQATPCPPITGAHSTHPAASLHQTATAPSAAGPVFHNLSTEFSTISSVFHSGFLSPWLSLRETA